VIEKNNLSAGIIGGGLAAYFLATNLVNRGVQVTLFSDPEGKSASSVAAGLVNPVTGRQYAVSWRAVECLNALDAFFQMPVCSGLEKYFHRLPVYRPFPDTFSLNEWTGRSAWPEFSGLCSPDYTPWQSRFVFNPLGGMVHNRSGWLDIPVFLEALHNNLLATGYFQGIKEKISPAQIQAEIPCLHTENSDFTFDHLIFCEGMYALDNPWFPIPLIPLKGQILNISTQPIEGRILSSGIFMIPLGNEKYRLGSTYERNFTHTEIDDEGRQILLEDLKRMWLPEVIGIDKQVAGLRPTSPDRFPFIGQHPELKKLWILNGLGAKGVLQGPLMAAVLTEAMVTENADIIYPEVQWNRNRRNGNSF